MKSERIDYVLFLSISILLVFGLVMMTSIGVPKSIALTKPPDELFPSCGTDGVDCYRLLKQHAVRFGIGLLALFLALRIPLRFWKKIAIPFFFLVFLLLISVFLIGTTNNTFSRSWINIANTSIQPAEIAKLALILYLATWMARRGQEIKDFKNGFLSFGIVIGFIILPVLLQPDLGSTIIFVVIASAMYFTAGARLRHIALGLTAIFLFMLLIVPNVSYLKHRFIAYLFPSVETCQPVEAGEVRRNYCWQTEQANIAVGSGGFFGKGLTQGIQKSYWLPQATDDFIFAASAEELGFLRISLVVILYIIIAYRGFLISVRASDRFQQLLATGITTWITMQAFINIAVNTGLLPVTGITLPFVSYGGSSMVSTLIGVGILLQISRSTDHTYANRLYRRRDRRTYHSQYRHFEGARRA